MLRAATLVAPVRRVPRQPLKVDLLESIGFALGDSPRDVAFWACLTTTFWATARLGEFVVPRIDGFDPRVHVKPKDVLRKFDPGMTCHVMNFRLPRTKVSETGEDVMWAPQPGTVDPQAAYERHVRVNAPPEMGPLFAYRDKGAHTPLTRARFLSQLKAYVRARTHHLACDI